MKMFAFRLGGLLCCYLIVNIQPLIAAPLSHLLNQDVENPVYQLDKLQQLEQLELQQCQTYLNFQRVREKEKFWKEFGGETQKDVKFILCKRKERTKHLPTPGKILRNCCVFQISRLLFQSLPIESGKFWMQYLHSEVLNERIVKGCDIVFIFFDKSKKTTPAVQNSGRKLKRNRRDSATSGEKSRGLVTSVGATNVKKAMYNISAETVTFELNSTQWHDLERRLYLQNSKDPYWAFLCVVTINVMILYLVYWTKLCQNNRSDLQYIEYIDDIHLTTVNDAVTRKARFLDIFRKWKKSKRKRTSIKDEEAANLLLEDNSEDSYT